MWLHGKCLCLEKPVSQPNKWADNDCFFYCVFVKLWYIVFIGIHVTLFLECDKLND